MTVTDTSDRTLTELGWRPFFSEQLSEEERRDCLPVRVMAVHRGMVTVAGQGLEKTIVSTLPDQRGPEDRPTVSDWLLIDRETHLARRILDRANLFKRPAPGDDRRIQLIAANVDTLFIVTSCNQDFNVARLERYLVLAREVQVNPIIVLTKIDLADDAYRYLGPARALQAGLEVEVVDGRDFASIKHLAARCGPGETVALVGSSGVGKSTLINTLRQSPSIATQPVREDDGKGRHTTTVREMHRLALGGWLVDTPGMRELQLSEATTGLAEVFDDIAAMVLDCRFTNCTHEAEPGCAVRDALSQGTLDRARLGRWRKLSAEDNNMNMDLPMRSSRGGRSPRRN